MKLNKDMPEQHMAILALSGVFVVISLVDWARGPQQENPNSQIPAGTFAETGITRYENPHMSWYERLFCRGYQRSASCSFRLLHPFGAVLDDSGVKVEEKAAQDGVVDYRGPLKRRSLFGEKIRFEPSND